MLLNETFSTHRKCENCHGVWYSTSHIWQSHMHNDTILCTFTKYTLQCPLAMVVWFVDLSPVQSKEMCLLSSMKYMNIVKNVKLTTVLPSMFLLDTEVVDVVEWDIFYT